MKKKILRGIPFLLAICAFNINVNAQDQHQKEPKRQKRNAEVIIDSLNLKGEKAEKFKVLYEERQKAMQAERKERKEMHKAYYEKKAELNKNSKESFKAYQDKLSEILNEDELQQLHSMYKPKNNKYKKDQAALKHQNKECKQDKACCNNHKNMNYKKGHRDYNKKQLHNNHQQKPYKINHKEENIKLKEN